MTNKAIDRAAPVQGALIVHPQREGAGAARSPEARLDEAVGLAGALDLMDGHLAVADDDELEQAVACACAMFARALAD